MLRRRRFILTIFAIALLLQARAYVWVDALTQQHYWHSERCQYEHVPKNITQNDAGTTESSPSVFASQSLSWVESPCLVPALLRVDPAVLEDRVVLARLPDLDDFFTLSSSSGFRQAGVIHFAPKHSPPQV